MSITKLLAVAGPLILLGGLLLFPHTIAGQSPPAPQLRLHRGTFNAQIAGPAGPGPVLTAAASGPYAIIQLRGPITVADRQALEQSGLMLLEYLPDYAYLVRGSPAQLDEAAALPQVYARAFFTLADKLSPALLRAIARGTNDLGPVRIIGWPDGQSALTRELGTLGLGDQQAAVDLGQLMQLLQLDSVRWVEPSSQPRLLNDYARTIMKVDQTWQTHQLFGAGQTVAIADTGLDTGDFNTLSPDFAGRIVATQVLSAGGDWADGHGHGTHVAGSVAGAGVQSGANPAQRRYENSFAGIAPEANLVIQGFEVASNGSVIGLDPDYYQLFDRAYAAGARLHSDSWGDITGPLTDPEAAYGGYPYGAQRTDQFIWDHPDMAIFFAAGNSGQDGTPGLFGFCFDGDGVVDVDSLLFPGTAKNVITVGASESNRSGEGLGSTPWILISFCFLAEPIAPDIIANNANGMAAFSSRGPVDDGRTKPDIVAPGTNIVSNRSHEAGATTLWGAHQTNPDHYVYSGGTSMATPLVAGMGALVRQWLSNQGLPNPSAAAVKATLLNTAQDISPGQYGPGATQEIPFNRPNSVSGWGRADLGFLNAPPPYTLWVDDHLSGLGTGQVVSYTSTLSHPLTVLTSTQSLRVLLAWTDSPASLSASAQLVNDLDLVIIGPDRRTYYGNGGPSEDRTNNVEGVIINTPSLGPYQVEVRGFNVPVAGQSYALAIAGPLGGDGGTDIGIDEIYLPLIVK